MRRAACLFSTEQPLLKPSCARNPLLLFRALTILLMLRLELGGGVCVSLVHAAAD